MKQGIHPNWHHDCLVTCACGNSFTTGSGSKTLQIDICSACHPFFTGEMKFVDRQGRVDRFMQKMKAAQTKKATRKAKKKSDKPEKEQKSYQQILREQHSQIKKAEKDQATPATTA